MRSQRQPGFEDFVRSRRSALLRTAVVLTAGDRHLAEDLVQMTLVRLYLSWGRTRQDTVDSYARRILVNCLIDEKRRAKVRREVSLAAARTDQPDGGLDPVSSGPVAVDPALIDALRQLPVGMRTAVVLRHVDGLSVHETATSMNCSEGNVKSQTARGLERIRDLIDQRREAAT